MKGIILCAFYYQLGIIPDFSRPGVSDDNPYIESFFKTTKYHAGYPKCFHSLKVKCAIWPSFSFKTFLYNPKTPSLWRKNLKNGSHFDLCIEIQMLHQMLQVFFLSVVFYLIKISRIIIR